MSRVPTAVPAPHDIAPASESSGVLAMLHEWVVTVDHKRLGVMYVVTGSALGGNALRFYRQAL